MDYLDRFCCERSAVCIIILCSPIPAIIILIALSFHIRVPHNCYIQDFYVPALDLSTQTNSNTTISTNPCLFFNLALVNVHKDRGVRYSDINLTFSYGQKVVAKYTVPKFYQGAKKTAHRRDVVETSGMPWDDALKVVFNGSKAVFRVDLAARPSIRVWFWFSKKKLVKTGADVEVDGFGMKAKKDDIRLINSALKPAGVWNFVLFLSIFVTCFMLC